MGAGPDALGSSGRFRLDRLVGVNRTTCAKAGTTTLAAPSTPSPNGTCHAWDCDPCRLTVAKRASRRPLVQTGLVRRHQALGRHDSPKHSVTGQRLSVLANITNMVARRLPPSA